MLVSSGATCPLVEHVEPSPRNLPEELAQNVIHLAAFPPSEPRISVSATLGPVAGPQRTVLDRMERVTSRAAPIGLPLIGDAHEVGRTHRSCCTRRSSCSQHRASLIVVLALPAHDRAWSRR
jgi:hypothetical protein